MKALAKTRAGPGLELVERSVPEPGPGEVRIKVLQTAICGTDLHIYNWDAWAAKTILPPQIAGHEFVGKVDKLGPYVHDVHVGELVSGEGHIVCGVCRNCRAGLRHLCHKTQGVGVNRDGAFAEFICIPVANVWHCDENIPLDVLTCFDPLGNATHTALSFDLLGEDVLITGAGPIGIMAAAIARHCGARYVVVTDVQPHRLEMAARLGATHTVLAGKKTLAEIMRELDMKEGFDVGMEMSGNASALREMISSMAHGGNIALMGIQGAETAIDWDQVVFNGLTLKGIYGREMFETWYKMTMMIRTGLDISPLITHRFRYTDFEKAFALMREGRCGKIILNWAEPALK